MQSNNYVPGVSGWKMFGDGTLVIDGRVRAKLNPGTEKAETPYVVVGDQVILSEAFVDASKMSSDYALKVSTNAQGQMFCAGIGVVDSAKSHVENRCEAQLTDRIKTLESCVAQLNSELGRLVVAISSLVSVSAKQ
ncbi:hypothetical protein V2I60_19935 [Pseudomonas viridiflava]|uniref:hypothetical protein n=1 Tax=Pseudomonas viridiflava TaxID=33069 RepID=UPI002E99D43C|nr:hypothetical protein [Pseudomonas viridiflava]